MREVEAPSFDGTQPCKFENPDLFFPERPEIPKELSDTEKRSLRARYSAELRVEANKAKIICNACKFVQPCLEYSLRNDVVGVWGATTERERSAIRRLRKMPTPKSITSITSSWANKKGAH